MGTRVPSGYPAYVNTEWRWLSRFRQQFELCGLNESETCIVLSESGSRPALVETAVLAAQSLGADTFQVVMPTPANQGPVALRSTGTSLALQSIQAAIIALQNADFVVDCTMEGLLHSRELGAILGAGTRVLMISNEHPENFERLPHDVGMAQRVEKGYDMICAASTMRVTSEAGTDLTVHLDGSFRAGSTGVTSGPGSIAHWPGGLVLTFPAAHSVDGTVVLAPGDMNLTFNRLVESPVVLHIVDDHVMDIEGHGLDAELMRGYWKSWEDAEGHRAWYATSHVGFGLNRAARWDALAFYDKRDCNGTELRAFAGNFLYSTGANEVAKRFTQGHFDLPMRGCTVQLDSEVVVRDGQVA